ncbi:uncharacterized protein MEPE_05886 [Melanopsichium pennsylvanicum]|uniref:Uncharacterized protein n=1 Tax=Melanopsichium pennsylvanicum TaxID=63383 RepID=A0AAJ4XSL4_9BASI|nr:uncharacterized protein MEPE_05886 [Melanopsichium pennsylvanicum]
MANRLDRLAVIWQSNRVQIGPTCKEPGKMSLHCKKIARGQMIWLWMQGEFQKEAQESQIRQRRSHPVSHFGWYFRVA